MSTGLGRQKVTKSYRGLGTVIDLTVYGTADSGLLDAAFELIAHYEDLFTVNRTSSEVLSISQAAGQGPVQVSPATYGLVKKAVQVSQQHFGFNVAIGPLVKLWHIGFEDAHVPSADEIQRRKGLTNPDSIRFDDAGQTVFLPVAGMELDLGGIAKGYIADRVQDFFRAQGLSSAIINLGGNLLLMGKAPHHPDQLWRVGIRQPLVSAASGLGGDIAIVSTPASSVVTSGIAERHLEAEGKTYHHIIDPETGYPHDNDVASVTVFTEQSIDGEIETTRLFFADSLVKNYPYRAIYVFRDRSIKLANIDPERVRILDTNFHLEEKNDN